MTDDTGGPAEWIAVPDFRGMQALNAWLRGHDAGLLLEGPDPDSAEPLLHGVVAAQRPDAGIRLHRWDVVTVWLRDVPGLGGAREPRRPVPPVRTLAGEREPTGGVIFSDISDDLLAGRQAIRRGGGPGRLPPDALPVPRSQFADRGARADSGMTCSVDGPACSGHDEQESIRWMPTRNSIELA